MTDTAQRLRAARTEERIEKFPNGAHRYTILINNPPLIQKVVSLEHLQAKWETAVDHAINGRGAWTEPLRFEATDGSRFSVLLNAVSGVLKEPLGAEEVEQ